MMFTLGNTNIGFLDNKLVIIHNILSFSLLDLSMNAHINVGANLSVNIEPHMEAMVPIPLVILEPNTQQKIQQENINMIQNSSQTIIQVTPLRYLFD